MEKSVPFTSRLAAWAAAAMGSVAACAKRIREVGEDDPRRVIHSFKVALAITLVSMVYYLRPFYSGLGDAGIWAILTVVVVFEFTAGATLCKGMNRGIVTLLAGALGVAAECLARLSGRSAEPIVLGCLVFLLVAAATFSRFIPAIKKRYDYGVLIFILTFSMVAVSSNRDHQIVKLEHQRLSTIALGGAACMFISIFFCPVWAGEDLHNLIVSNLEKLANFLEEFGGEYYKAPVDGESGREDEKSFLAAYKSVLNSKATEESLSNFAWWEPRHGKFRKSHPWKLYLKIGVLSRKCAYQIEALNGYLDAKLQGHSEFRKTVQEPCTKISSEAGKALKELAISIKSMSHPYSSAVHLRTCKTTIEELNVALQTSIDGNSDVLAMVPVIAVVSTLIDVIKCVESISEAVDELSKQAHFKKPPNVACFEEKGKPKFICRGTIIPVKSEGDGGFVAIMVEEIDDSREKNDPQKPNKET